MQMNCSESVCLDDESKIEEWMRADGKGMYILYRATTECMDDAADMLDVESTLDAT